MIEVGKLYSCSKYFLLLFPDKEAAAESAAATASAAAAAPDAVVAASIAVYWSEVICKPVSYCDPETPLLVLSVKEQYIQVLAGDKRGWIINMDWLNIKDIR